MSHHLRSNCVGLIGAAALLLSVGKAEALVINYDFGTGFAAGSNQRLVANAAKEWWERAILQNFTVDINLQFAAIGGAGTAGRTHSNMEMALPDPFTGTRLPTEASIDLNLGTTFFFDNSPHENSEFNMSMENGLFGMCIVAACMNNADALSVIKHELGHALGFIGSTDTYSDGTPFTAYTDFVNNFSNAAMPDQYVFDFLVGGKQGNKGGMGGAFGTVPFDAGRNHIDGTAAGNPVLSKKLMAVPGFLLSQRSLQTPLDIDILGDAFHVAINDMPTHEVPVPEPSTLTLFGAGLAALAFLMRRRRMAA